MAYLEQFEHDVFISYAHDNNTRGWVSDLRDVLEERLVSYLGSPPRPSVWFDNDQVTGMEEIKRTIPTACQRSAALLCVLSPSYLRSEWCKKEREAFLAQLSGRPGGRSGPRIPLLKVVLLELEGDDEPEELRGLVGYRYFEGRPEVPSWTRQFFLKDKNHLDQRFFNQTDRLARELAETLKAMKRAVGGASAPVPADKDERRVTPTDPLGQAIYIAEGTDDVDDDRDLLAKEFGQFDVLALPAEELPTGFDALRARIRDLLQRCQFSVHIIGRYYGTRLTSDPSAVKRSAPQIQYEVAVEERKPRIVWLSGAIDEEQLHPDQRAFLATIRNQHGSDAGLEFVRGGLQELKALVHSRIRRPPRSAVPEAGPVVFISAHKDDLERREVMEILNRCERFGCDGFASAFHADPQRGEERDDSFIRRADGVVILYASPYPDWVRERAWKVREVVTRRRRNPLMAALVDSEPPPPDRPAVPFKTPVIAIVDARNGFDPAMLDPFFNQLRRPRRAR
jgi:hypothetical protein